MSSLPSSSSISKQQYDVFLSFRGEDTRLNFTDHLFAALKRSGIITFRDDSKLEAGEEIEPELFKVIQQSWCSIIIFSKTYPCSSWCLEELAEIVKQKKERGHKIFPIFYGVDPSDLRKQKEKVEKAFTKHEERYNKEKIRTWRDALTEVANIKGWHSNNRHESEFIEDIVIKISAKFCQTYPVVFDGLIGINSRLEELYSKINIGEDDVRIIGICGMGGIGKTTLASVVSAQMSSHFEGESFLEHVRKVPEEELAVLQKKLLSQILPNEGFNFFNVHKGNAIISHRLSRKKVLVVIDDVDNILHLKCLAGRRDWFGLGSRIIVTTRDKQLLQSHQVDDVYEPATLNYNEALQLFNLKAFNSVGVPQNDLSKLSEHVVKYAGGLPLALEVLGSFLCGRDAAQWRSAIERLERDSDKNIIDRLQIGFDGLEESEKNIFLDMACFFGWEDKDLVTKVLDGCEFFPDIGIDVLIKKSLLKVSERFNYLGMHDLLKEMGRKIVREKSVEPGKRCRLWEQRDVYHVLTKNTGTEAIECMVINITSEPNKIFTLRPDAFLKMKKLRLLKVSSSTNCRGLKYLPDELRLLHWWGCPLRSLPSNLPDNLVALILSRSRIEQLWKGTRPLYKLKEIDLIWCENLIKTPDFTTTPNLEILNLVGCTKLADVHPSIGALMRLKRLDLGGCKNLRSLPAKIGMKNLERLSLSGCSNLKSFPEIDGEMKRLRELSLDGTGIEGLPSSIGNLNGLKLLNLRDCKSLRSLPAKIGMESLEELILSGCSNLKSFPEIDGETECLQKLYLNGSGIEGVPSFIGSLSRLKLLNLTDCKSLRSLPVKIEMETLEQLILSSCSNFKSFPEIDGKMKCLGALYLDGTGIERLPSSIGNLSSLYRLSLTDCRNLVSLPSSIGGCKSLLQLYLSGCYKVENLPENLQQAELLWELALSETAITKPPSFIFQFKNLIFLSFNGCKGPSSKLGPNLPSLSEEIQRGKMDYAALKLPQLSGLSSLLMLSLRDCNLCDGDIPSDICCLSSLRSLDLGGNNFINIPATLIRLSKLEELVLSNCKELKSLPELLTSIETLMIDGCTSLEVVASPSTVCNSKSLVNISAINCCRLAENNNALTLLKKHLKVFANSRRRFDIIIPGSEIPEWFSRQRGESSLKIPLPSNIRNDSQWMGVAFCCIFVDDDASEEVGVACKGVIHGRTPRNDENCSFRFYRAFNPPIVKDHLFLRYWSRDNLYPVFSEYDCDEHETENLSKTDCSDQECDELEVFFRYNFCAKVKKCGVRIVYEKDLEEMEQTKEQHSSQSSANFEDIHQQSADDGSIGNGSRKKRKRNAFEEVEAGPQPKPMKRFFNFIMGPLGKNINSGKPLSPV